MTWAIDSIANISTTDPSTAGTSRSKSSWWVSFTFDIYQYEIAYLDPLMVLVGLLGNAWAVLLFLEAGRIRCLGGGLQLSASLRLYYATIAIADLVDCARNIPWDLLCKTAAFFSNNTVFFCFESLSYASCVVIHFWYFASETIANYALVALSAERFAAVYFPLWFRSHSTFKNSVILLASVSLPPLVLLSVLNPLGSKVADYGPQDRFCYYSPDQMGVVFEATLAVVLLGLHSAVELLILTLVLLKLRRAHSRRIAELSGVPRKQRDSNAISTSGRAKDSARDGNTIAMIALCSINAAVYVSAGLAQLRHAIVSRSSDASADAKDEAKNVFLVFVIFAIFPHSINVFVYLIFLPRFRRATRNCFLCHCAEAREHYSNRSSNTFHE